jgi:hypothetical protein
MTYDVLVAVLGITLMIAFTGRVPPVLAWNQRRSESSNGSSSSSSSGASSRRAWIQQQHHRLAIAGFTSVLPSIFVSAPAAVADFTPGGSLITDKAIGILVNNNDASSTRKYDNSNVLFDKDYYYKFGTAVPYIEPPGNTEFPTSMPFTKSQQRYDAMKKYRDRVVTGLEMIKSLENVKLSVDIPDPKLSDDVYRLRAMGLLANALLVERSCDHVGFILNHE